MALRFPPLIRSRPFGDRVGGRAVELYSRIAVKPTSVAARIQKQ